MLIALAWAALRRRPFSVLCTLVLGSLLTSLARLPVPAAVLVWVIGSLFALEVCLLCEPFILDRLNCRQLTPREHERLGAWMRRFNVTIRIADDAVPWVGGGLRTVVVSRGALELIGDYSLFGLIGHAAMIQRGPILLREVVVWLGNLPLIAGLCASRWLLQVGRMLAIPIAYALVLPAILWPSGFVRWVGAVLGAVLVALIGAVLISGGQPGPGLALWLAWAIVPGLRALLAWEARHAQAEADRAAVRDGFGWHLHEGLEVLASLDGGSAAGWLRLLTRPGAPLHARMTRVWKALCGG